MGIYENIKKAAELRHTTINKIEKDLSFARSSIAKFNAHTPAADKLLLIAGYLHVTMESLMRTPETQAIIDQVFSSTSTGKMHDTFIEEFQKDPVFMDHIRLLWSLDEDDMAAVYKTIKGLYYSSKEEKEKEVTLNA